MMTYPTILQAKLILEISHFSQKKRNLVSKAIRRAAGAHYGQTRRSGLPYIVHPFRVALTAAKRKCEPNVVIAALLHDLVEDTFGTLEDIEREFGPDVARIVDGVTKLPKLNESESYLKSMEKLLSAMMDDHRIAVVKIFDRLDNMRTMSHMPSETQITEATETIVILVPIAHYLGMEDITRELEALSFKYIKVISDSPLDRNLRGLVKTLQAQLNFLEIACNAHLE